MSSILFENVPKIFTDECLVNIISSIIDSCSGIPVPGSVKVTFIHRVFMIVEMTAKMSQIQVAEKLELSPFQGVFNPEVR